MKKIGEQSLYINTKISIIATSAVVGPKEGKGPLGKYFNVVKNDILAGEESWEKAESEIVKEAMELAVKNARLHIDEIDYVISGDLLNQSIGSTFGIKELNRPYLGVFSACATFGEAMSLGGMLIDGDFATKILIGASSHFCSAEKQFRFPLGLGTQRPLTTTWTVTGCGSAVLSKGGDGPFIKKVTTGKIVDLGIADTNNMGAAMAPAAADTIYAHFNDFNIKPSYYDLIITGDLGYLGSELLIKLLEKRGLNLKDNYTDCGIQIFDREKQDTHCGGSGCACSAVTFANFYYEKLKSKELSKILFVPTGALLSTTSAQQGETIPCIAHAIGIEI